MGQNVTLTSSDGFKFSAYRADPKGKPKGAIVVIQEIFGVNHHIRAVTDRLADEGYVAIAPAIFDRIKPGFETGYTPDEIAEARKVVGAADFAAMLRDTQAAIDAVKDVGPVGITGFCLGGTITFLAATQLTGIKAGVAYYGGMIAKNADQKAKVPLMMHFGEKDAGIPLTHVDEVKKHHPDLPCYIYPADHGFNCEDRKQYDAAAAKLARQRTLEFFRAHIG